MPRDIPNFPVAPILRSLGVEVPDVRRGYVMIFCPFHDDRRGKSASVREYSFKCFGCDRSGDAIKLLIDEEGLSFTDAVDRCRELTGLESDGVREGAGWADSSLLD